MKKCKDCGEEPYSEFRHVLGDGFCEKCGACLYKNSKQVPDNNFPLFKCTKCGAVNFWD